MPTQFRPAQVGDICILLLPDDDELTRLNEHQRFLTSHFGGQIHQAVHLTVQRFAPPTHSNLQPHSASLRGQMSLISSLAEKLVVTPPLSFTALSSFSIYSNFKNNHIVKWEIPATDELRRYVSLTNRALDEVGVLPTDRYTDDWISTWVTALDGVTNTEITGEQIGVKYPHHLFTARRIWLSEIKEGNGYEVLAQMWFNK
jgi:hypothetical protein